MKKSGIYCIENLKNEKKYIGQTANLKRRKHEHFSSLRENCHFNSHLQNAYNKYGEENFKFRILFYCKPFELTKYEQIFVDYYAPELLYNIRLECVDSNQGIIPSKETKEKISNALSGENHPNYGKHHSKETKEKMSKALSGENHPMYGKHLSKEAKEKLSKANSGEKNGMYGKKHSEETRKKISKANSGRHLSEKTKIKIGKAFSGEKSYTSKITEQDVLEILDLYYNKNKMQIEIEKMFSINNRSISHICRGKTWKNCYKKFMKNK